MCYLLNSRASHWISVLFNARVTETYQRINAPALVSSRCTAVWILSQADKWSVWRGSNESCCFVPLLVHKLYIEHLSNSCLCFIKENYTAIIIVIVLSPSPNPSYMSNDRTHCGNNPLDSSGWELLAFGLVHQSHAQRTKVKGHSLQKSLSRISPVLRELWSKGRKDEQSEELMRQH